MGRLVLALIVSLVTGCCQIPATNHVAEADAVAQITYKDRGYCTAFHLGDGIWGTASHCVEFPTMPLVPPQIRGTDIEVISVDTTHDVALARGPQQYAKLRLGQMPRFGAEVYYIGYPWYADRYHHQVYRGNLGESHGLDGWEFSGFVDGGASGSPLLYQGRVVGVVVASYRGAPYSFAADVKHLQALLNVL